jgi:hypothetical protein
MPVFGLDFKPDPDYEIPHQLGDPTAMRLVLNPGSPAARELQLQPGPNHIGRNPANDFTIDDPSVSSYHAEIQVLENSAVIKDLGSTNGTFVHGIKVQEISLQPGETFRLGSVEIQLQSEDPEALASTLVESKQAAGAFNPASSRQVLEAQLAEPPPDPPPPLSDKPIFCKNHYQNPGLYRCSKCQKFFCDLCVNTRGSASGGLKFCKVCGTPCARMSVKAHVPKTVNFFQAVPEAFRYPFVGDGLILLFGGTLFFGFLDAANFVSRHAFQYGLRSMTMRAVIFTFILGTGYLFSFLKNVIHASAHGDKQMPDWPELSEWTSDIVSPMFQFVVISIVSFGPTLIVSRWADGDYPWLVALVALLGCCYFPMAFLGVAMFDTLTALNPLFIFGSILRVPREYAVAVLVFILIIGLRWLTGSLLERILHIPLVPTLLADLLVLGLLIVEARILGLLFLTQKSVLAWFKHL